MSSGLFKNIVYKLCIYKSYIIYVKDLALNNLQGLIKPNQTNLSA